MEGEDESGFTAALTKIYAGDIAGLRALLSSHPEAAAATDAFGGTPLHIAAEQGFSAAVELLLAAAPATAAAQVANGSTPLHLAALMGQTEAAALLLKAAPATAQAGDDYGRTPLHFAAEHGPAGGAAVARVLLAAAPDTAEAADEDGSTPLHYASAAGHIGIVQLLLVAAPATAAAVDTSQQTPLHTAAGDGRTAVVEALLAAAPAVAEVEDVDGQTPLELALGQPPHTSTARCLLPYCPASGVLAALAQAGPPALPLFADFVIGRPPLTAQEWALVPAPCPGLGRALPAALAHSPAQARQVVSHLPSADVQRLRTAALCLGRAQRRTRVPLPSPLVQQVLGLAMS